MVTALDNDISDISDIKVDSVGDFTFPERNKFEVGFGIIAKDIQAPPPMPTISRFYGISIKMFFEDHNPPHFHAVHGDHIGWFNIRTLELIKGDLPPRAIRLVKDWAAEHQDELLAIWEKHEFKTIPGLDA